MKPLKHIAAIVLCSCLMAGESCVIPLEDGSGTPSGKSQDGSGTEEGQAKPEAAAAQTAKAQEPDVIVLPKIPPKSPGPSAPKEPSDESRYLSWIDSCSLAAFEKTVPQDRTWSAEAGIFLKNALQSKIVSGWADDSNALAAQALSLLSKGCDDPLVRLWAGLALQAAGRQDDAIANLRKAAARLQGFQYPKLELAIASDALAQASKDAPSLKDLHKAAVNLAPRALAESALDQPPYGPPDQFAVLAGLRQMKSARLNPEFWRSAFDAASPVKDYPRPLLDCLELLASFEEAKNLASPKDAPSNELKTAFGKACALAAANPDRPEPSVIALEMLAACPSLGNPAKANEIFEKAVAARPDDARAYRAYLDFLSSWCSAMGVHDNWPVLAFGRLCLNSGRFESGIPRIYLDALFKTACLQPDFDWRAAFLKSGVRDEIERLYLGLLQTLPVDDRAARERLSMERVILLCCCEDYQLAKNVFARTPANPQLLNSTFDGRSFPWKPGSLQELEAQLSLFTGPNKALAMEWSSALRSNPAAAEELAAKIISKNVVDKPLASFVRLSTVWRLIGMPAGEITASAESDPLCFALAAKRFDAAKFLLENGWTIKKKGFESVKPLLLALGNEAPENLVRLIVSRGAEVDYKIPDSGETPLTLAIEKGMPRAAEFIADMGSDPNAKVDASGKTPLHLAASAKMSKLVEKLLRRSAKADAKDLKGDTPLHCAVAADDKDSAKALLLKGADPRAKNLSGLSPLDMAKERGDEAMFQLLSETKPGKQQRQPSK